MPITFACPGCSSSLTVGDAAAGRAGKCPHCKGPIQVPVAEEELPILAVTLPASAVSTSSQPAPPATAAPSPNLHAEVLGQIITQHGRLVCDDPRRLKALLADYLGKHPGAHDQPINLLVMALENRVVQDLLVSDALPGDMVRQRIAERLRHNLALTPEAAIWVVAAWASALGLDTIAPVASAVPLTPHQPVPAAESWPATVQAGSAWSPSSAATPLRRRPLLLALAGGGGGMLLVILCFQMFRPAAAVPSTPVTPAQAAPVSTWKVIFRSSDPSIWNDDVRQGDNHLAMALELVPSDIKHLRLTNMTTKDYVIIPMTKERIGRRSDDGRYGWNGANPNGWGGRHLGVYYRIWSNFERGSVVITANPNLRGWGFGHATYIDQGQHYAWDGQPIAKTVFEIAVTSQPLTEAETKKVLIAGNPRE